MPTQESFNAPSALPANLWDLLKEKTSHSFVEAKTPKVEFEWERVKQMEEKLNNLEGEFQECRATFAVNWAEGNKCNKPVLFTLQETKTMRMLPMLIRVIEYYYAYAPESKPTNP